MRSASIIIVNWNTGALLADCIRSIQKLPEYDRISAVVVIDNNSSDESLQKAITACLDDEKISFVRSGENLGFARASNVGIRRLPEHDTSDVLLLNPDTIVHEGSIAALLDALDDADKTGIVGSRLQYPNERHQESVRRFPTPLILATIFLKIHRMWPSFGPWKKYMAHDFDYSKRQEVDQVMGASFLIRREVIEAIGILDESFWVWFEEVDFCKRAKAAGWNIEYVPESVVTHYGGVSFHQLAGLKKSWPFVASALTYARKHFSGISVFLLYLLVPITVLLAMLAAFQHRITRRQNQRNL